MKNFTNQLHRRKWLAVESTTRDHETEIPVSNLPFGEATGSRARASFTIFAIAGLMVGCGLAALAQTQAARAADSHGGSTAMSPAGSVSAQLQPPGDPVADPKAVVTFGNARFTILTPQLGLGLDEQHYEKRGDQTDQHR